MLLSVVPPAARADSVLPNGDLKDGKSHWSTFIPPDSTGASCRFTAQDDGGHEGGKCGRLSSDDFARFSSGPYVLVPCKPTDRFRITFWLKNDGATIKGNTPGVFARLLLMHDGKAVKDASAVCVRLDGRVSIQSTTAMNLPALYADIPGEWTKVQAVFAVPNVDGVNQISGPSIFAWQTKGAFLVSDVSMEPVAADTPLSLVIATPAAASRTAVHTQGPLVNDQETLSSLDLDFPGMEGVRAAAASNNVDAVKQAYLTFRRTGSKTKFTVNPADRPATAAKKTDETGDEVSRHFIRNTYWFPPLSGDMGTPFDWKHNPVARSSPDFTFEWTYCVISRTGFWKQLADAYWKTLDERYAQTFVDQLTDFIRRNPADDQPPTGSLWRTLDASERMYDSWPYAYAHFLDSPAFTPEVQWLYLQSLLDHVSILKTGLEVPGRTGNWVVSECYALYAIGTLFPEFKDAATWRQLALDRMLRELDYCVPPDGFEAELTPNYHFFTLSSFVGPVRLAQLNNLPIPPEFHEKILSMYRAPLMTMDQRGFDVATNDSGIINAASLAKGALKLLGSDPLLEWAASTGTRGEAPPASNALPYAGFYTMRSGWNPNDFFLFFRAGPTGIAHEHEDMLEVTLRAFNRSLLFEQGTYSYNQSDWRRFVLGTSSHSTIIVDGNGQHRGRSSAPVTKPCDNPFVSTPLFDFVSGSYDAGYQKSVHDVARIGSGVSYVGPSDRSVSHTRRIVFLKPYYALVLDTLDGTGTHTFDSLYYLDSPSAQIDSSTQAVTSQNPGDVQLSLYPLDKNQLETSIVQGQNDPILGWFANEHRTVPTVRFRKTQEAPAQFATFLYPWFGERPQFAAEPLAVGEGAWGQDITTSNERAAVAISLDHSTRRLSLPGDGKASANAAGLIIRRPTGQPSLFGVWSAKSFSDASTEWSTSAPADLVWMSQGDQLTIQNSSKVSCTVTVARPFKISAELPPGQWLKLNGSGAKPTDTPVLFSPLKKSFPEATFEAYQKSHPATASAGNQAISVMPDQFTLPPGGELQSKVGVDHPVVVGWKSLDSPLEAHVNVQKAGWYRVMLRYCTAEQPIVSLMVNDQYPFQEAHECCMPATVGNPPSNGFSDHSDDWHEINPGNWRVWLEPGQTSIKLLNGGGRIVVDWLKLEPVATAS